MDCAKNFSVLLFLVLYFRGGEAFAKSLAWVFQSKATPTESLFLSFKEGLFKGFVFNDHPTVDHFRSFSCLGRKDHLYQDPTTKCRNYYRCLRSVKYSYICPEGHALDVEAQKCLPEEKVECQLVPPPTTRRCWLQPDGFYPDYEDGCSSYYRCYNQTVEEESQCQGETYIWDVATSSCGSGQHMICSPPSCQGLRDGLYPLPGSSCRAYFSCEGGLRTDMLCSHGTSFDYMKRECVPTSDSVCYEGVCEGKVNGLYAETRSSCDVYYECFNGDLLELANCPPGQIFDGDNCAQKSNFSCRVKEGESCSNKLDGVFSSRGCDGFYVCRDQRLIRSFECVQNFVFNGLKCVDARSFVCTSESPGADCRGKKDGYRAIEKSNCKVFFRCKKGKMISEHICPDKLVFNGRQCVFPWLFSCPGYEKEILPRNFGMDDYIMYQRVQ